MAEEEATAQQPPREEDKEDRQTRQAIADDAADAGGQDDAEQAGREAYLALLPLFIFAHLNRAWPSRDCGYCIPRSAGALLMPYSMFRLSSNARHRYVDSLNSLLGPKHRKAVYERATKEH